MPSQRTKSQKISKARSKKNSVAWFKDMVGKSGKGFGRAKLAPGKMFTFGYDAKHKKTLPYWDRFPLIVVLDVAPQGFIGLNFHYLSPKDREMFLKQLMKTADKKKNKFNVTWDSVKRIPNAEKMIHKYLYSQVKTSMLESPSSEWHNVIYLPYQRFVGASASSVWSK
jgi:hypothetical protein